tara:strand:+ start:1525 stop:2103 length:579 start_codon:yes stop_codon:yes gene_type:complete
MKKVFLDCGSNMGQGLHSIYNSQGMDYAWHIYCFEIMEEVSSLLEERDLFKSHPNIQLIKKAVWVEDGTLPLTLDHEKGISDFGGATNIMGDNWIQPNYLKHEIVKNAREVETINFSKFLSDNFTKDDFLVVKLDIEGAEYEVLEKLIADNTLGLINVLYVEWHNHLRVNKCDENFLREQINNQGIELHYWN